MLRVSPTASATGLLSLFIRLTTLAYLTTFATSTAAIGILKVLIGRDIWHIPVVVICIVVILVVIPVVIIIIPIVVIPVVIISIFIVSIFVIFLIISVGFPFWRIRV